VDLGQYPVETSDTITILEKIGHFLDDENEILYHQYKQQGYHKNEITDLISKDINLPKILTQSCRHWDGGYVIAGMLGHGDSFVMRDPVGIRPAFYYRDDEVVVAASERPVIQTVFNVPVEKIVELEPGNTLIIKKDGTVSEHLCQEKRPHRKCSFERIYFSRGTDADIYQERKRLGKYLAKSVLESIEYDLENTVFSYIPNTAAVAFRGLAEELDRFCDQVKKEKILIEKSDLTPDKLDKILSIKPRVEKIAVKDVKLRTFITEDSTRNDLVGHVYDITYGTVRKQVDSLVIVDDSIVRGTTLKQSIIRILARLEPRQIIIVSSAPQIRYPDCYGIDMAKLGDFIAFSATIQLLKETRQEHIINEVYKLCKEQEKLPKEKIVNHVRKIYEPFSPSEISEKIAKLVTSPEVGCNIKIIYQTIEDLHKACPGHTGDWYFTGNYPTPGGNKVVNSSFINYIEGKNIRAY